ncbi:MAG: hypothetical protein IJJ72_01555 [Bacteroidales bacterium]|nr:hypothetical protein [Bacteroidales bacterium]
MDSGEEGDWQRCFIVLEGEEIIGCTTAIPIELVRDGRKTGFYLRGNTIISPDKRGRGVSKRLYDRVNSYDNWLSVGITDIAWKIQPKYVNNFTPLRPINVYVALNGWIVTQIVRRLLKKDSRAVDWPGNIGLPHGESFVLINNINDLGFPEEVGWTTDNVELVRDGSYLQKRFFDIYCAEWYALYKYVKHEKTEGFAVLRRISYRGVEMVSVVDYRFRNREDERKAFRLAQKVARRNRIGLVFGMSSRKYRFFGCPFLIETPKKLNFATGNKDIDFSDLLVTSADSDLDFVYYR